MSRQVQLRRSSGGQARRRQPVRRASARLSAIQAVALLVMLATAAGVWGATAAPAFSVDELALDGARFTSPAQVRSLVGLEGGSPNAFRVATDRLADRLAALPAVLQADVTVRLPRTIVVHLVERSPILVWVVGERRFAVDKTGTLFGLVDGSDAPLPTTETPAGASPAATGAPSASPTISASAAATPSPTATASPSRSARQTPRPGSRATPSPAPSAARSPTEPPPSLASVPSADGGAAESPALPVVYDRRAQDSGLTFGSRLAAEDFDAALRLTGLTPADVDSNAAALAVVVDDAYGFSLSSVPPAWVAVFGFYTPTVRRTSMIPDQVQLLASLLAGRESKVAWVWLAGERNGTYLPK